jgi:transcriptional regulator with XRE-family HTH domain
MALLNPTDPAIQQKKNEPRITRRAGAHSATEQVGQRLRALRKAKNFSIRSLAERSGLSINTLSLIENGKTSPSVNTLHLLAESLNISITTFFENEQQKKRVVYQKAGERRQIVFPQGHMEKLSEGMPPLGNEPFITKLEPGANSGETPVVFAGREFIYCLEGHITYTVDGDTYPLSPGDSLIFDAYIPHSWRNTASASSRALLALCPIDPRDGSSQHSFMP